ncbi:MAG TPA: MarR family transcriptional regulator [Candidatus Syntrophoarchaeum butanivorans]|uniref:B-block binding subunit of TFIIIC n=1 Tax=Candidatus Syntropharchaeum butanivorans TaxID=1839936 RepID=A0A1F2P5A6_9EURY|nr:MAG: B-block binding subunit of TFIIIC [Candidatus Syntrophoarchaeum butanivorans]RJS73198.1 MAG: MarR family transcriptional regulator [Candidatus Syntrophoarchaeum sp. WYZ-LMO15]HDM35756.1 MarR family transcriptional regulator [Candidatus Syntrophoarchaeum butanivorans]HEC57909.1 MarR family transcriptional regulator [Candidatus Syntrophoarchaeum butanivorans]
MVVVLEETILKLIASEEKEGIRQSDIWKQMGIDSRTCSRIITRLENKGLIIREWETVGNTRTYRIWYVGKNGNGEIEAERIDQPGEIGVTQAPKLRGNHSFLVVKDTLAPCVNCKDRCTPETCIKLTEWINLLI